MVNVIYLRGGVGWYTTQITIIRLYDQDAAVCTVNAEDQSSFPWTHDNSVAD